MTRRVIMVALPLAQPLDVVGPYEVFAGANQLLRARGSRDPGYALRLVSPGGEPVRGASGLGLLTDEPLERVRADRLHTLMVCGGLGARQRANDPALKTTVKRLAKAAQRVTSVCTGAFVLAAAGLLDERRATTHWAHCRALAERHPRVRVEAAPIYVRDERVWTSAGVTAGIDLALALVEDDLGPKVASEIARQLVVFVRRAGGQAQFSAQLEVQSSDRASIRDLMAWVIEHPDAQLDVATLARRTHLSVRHFARIFRGETGCTPAEYVERVRIDAARRLLEQSERSIEEVASTAGFGTPESLRRAFARNLDLSPREYRARFSTRRRGSIL